MDENKFRFSFTVSSLGWKAHETASNICRDSVIVILQNIQFKCGDEYLHKQIGHRSNQFWMKTNDEILFRKHNVGFQKRLGQTN